MRNFTLRNSTAWLLRAVLIALGACSFSGAFADESEKITFDDHIKPIFREHCFVCHDSDSKSGSLAIDSMTAISAGGAGGAVVEAGSPDSSRLWQLVNHDDTPIMPPDQGKIPAAQLALIRKWIEGGLLENINSKAKLPKRSAVSEFKPSSDNRPTGEPAMPIGVWCEPVLVPEFPGAAGAIAASPWAPLVAVGGQRQVSLYNTDTKHLVGVLPFVEGVPQAIRFSRNGDLLVVAGGRGASLGVVALFDVKTGRRLTTLGDEVDVVLAADITPDHSLVALGGPRKKVRTYRTADGAVQHEIGKHTDWVMAIEFSPDGKHLATGDRSGNAYIWEAATGRPVATIAGHKGPITSISWRADSQLLATASDDGTVKLWSPIGTSIRSINANPAGVTSVQFTADGRLLVAGRNPQVKLFDVAGKQLDVLTTTTDITLAAVATHDQKFVITGDYTGEVRVVGVADKETHGTLAINPPSLPDQIAHLLAEQKQRREEAETLSAQIDATSKELKSKREQIAAMHTEFEVAKREHAELQQQVTVTTAKVNAAKASVEKHNVELTQLREATKMHQGKIATLQNELADATAVEVSPEEDESQEGVQAAIDVQQLEKQIGQVEIELAKSRAEAEQVKAKLQVVRNEQKAGYELLKQLRPQVGASNNRVKAAERAIKSPPDLKPLEVRLAKKSAAMQAIGDQLKAIDARIAELVEQQKAIAREPEQLESALASQRQQLDNLQNSTATANDSRESLQTEIASLQTRLGELQTQLAASEESAKKATAELAEVAAKVEATEARLEERQAIDALRQRASK